MHCTNLSGLGSVKAWASIDIVLAFVPTYNKVTGLSPLTAGGELRSPEPRCQNRNPY